MLEALSTDANSHGTFIACTNGSTIGYKQLNVRRPQLSCSIRSMPFAHTYRHDRYEWRHASEC